MITTIIFDLSEVYLTGFKGIEVQLAPIIGVNQRQRHIHNSLNSTDLNLLFNGEITEEEYWQKTIQKNGWIVDVDTLKRVVRKNFGEIRGTKRIIVTLKKRGLKLGLLSVHAKEWVAFCQTKFNYHGLFDAISYSFEVGFSKPDRRAYLLLLERLGSNPDECLFIDDNPRNLSTAEMLGMKTILFENPLKLKSELGAMGLLDLAWQDEKGVNKIF